ncbi:MAG TPA: carbon-nitrogen hydrolase family protein [Planctomycetota bacterium]|nr:carbon-nitrogen hydrolase family protein [Planctomycetota bacterium]
MTSATLSPALSAIAIPASWTSWSHRPATAPAFAVDGAALRITAGDAGHYGAWRREISGLVSGRTYRLSVRRRTQGLDRPGEQAVARLRWIAEDDGWLPDYLLPTGEADAATTLALTIEAPPGTRGVIIDLSLRLTGGGTVWWDAIAFGEVPPPAPRLARIATVRHRPRDTAGPAASVASFVRLFDALQPGAIDLVCLPEGISVVGTGKTYADVAEAIPGPSTAALGSLAKRLRAHVCAGIYERVGERMYNTAVLIGRDGDLIGTYRKTHLPQNEADGGMTPGDSFPVYATDIGRIGMMVCWDNQFPEPARRLAANGAEIICMPIWGGFDLLTRARAQENHVHLISSSYDMRCMVVDPLGEVVGEADAQHPIAIAEVDLGKRRRQYWVGDFGGTVWAERRGDL